MLNRLHLWDADLACPATFLEACHQRASLEEQLPGPNPKFVALARALQPPALCNDVRWARRQAAEAPDRQGALWAMWVEDENLHAMLHHVIHSANAVGLVVLSETLDLAFLPGGRVLSPDGSPGPGQTPAQLLGHALQQDRPDTGTRLADGLQQLLAPHGFMRQPDPQCFARFERPGAGGSQAVILAMGVNHGLDFCRVSCHIRDEALEAVFAQVFGADLRPRATFWFHPSTRVEHLQGYITVANGGQRQQVLDAVRDHGLPVLDLARTPGGLDQLMNQPGLFPYRFDRLHPRSPQNLADQFVQYGGLNCLKPLIAAHQAGNPQFDTRVADLRRFVQGRADVQEAQLMQLVAHLRPGAA